jgi:hypothetical protein
MTQALAALARQRAQTEAQYRKSLLADLDKAKTSANEHGEDAVKAMQRRELQTGAVNGHPSKRQAAEGANCERQVQQN